MILFKFQENLKQNGLLNIYVPFYVQGRVVVLPRYEFVTKDAKPSMGQFVSNAVKWLAKGSTSINLGTHTTEQVCNN
jgi:hypothetical protein